MTSPMNIKTRCDVEEVARAVVTLLNDPDRRRSMGQSARIAAKEHYTWPSIVDGLTREYAEVIRRHHANGIRTLSK
jgi:glycosyltransferase involved in cell wall biosynthesis